MVRERDGTLIGVIHGGSFDVEEMETTGKFRVLFNKFMKIEYYFNWISHVTGISLPECGPSPPPPNIQDVQLLLQKNQQQK